MTIVRPGGMDEMVLKQSNIHSSTSSKAKASCKKVSIPTIMTYCRRNVATTPITPSTAARSTSIILLLTSTTSVDDMPNWLSCLVLGQHYTQCLAMLQELRATLTNKFETDFPAISTRPLRSEQNTYFNHSTANSRNSTSITQQSISTQSD